MTAKRPPDGLSARAKRLWRVVTDVYALADWQLSTLASACRQIDRAESARELLDRDGVVVTDRFGQPREHPAVSVERNAHLAIARLLRELNLDVAPPDSRPPKLRY